MQISVETTRQSASLATFSSVVGGTASSAKTSSPSDADASAATSSALESASKKAAEDSSVIAALQAAVEFRRGESAENSARKAMKQIEDYQKTAGQLKQALGMDVSTEETEAANSAAFEAATVSTTTIEAQIGGSSLSAQFVSYERASYSSSTGLSVRSASASSIQTLSGNTSASYQSASVSSFYAGTGSQLADLLEGYA
ncbi:hypothetical protein [Roseibium litorale]|uniref:Uncharacterized protein n=1 Tax=Roseibium litorale TaxID=2803841 RepID=A0ABR9CQ09_9HYPH|nr:hypothetical protein [Roseibium litorale]MBD8892377.1 hypothetical protein [Roseibium litorale]